LSKISIDADSLLYHATSLNLVGSSFCAISSALEAHSSERPERFSANYDPGSLPGRLNKKQQNTVSSP